VPAAVVVAADPGAAFCDVPALLLTRLPGGTPGLPRDMGAFLAQLAGTLTEIHAVDGRARELISAYRRYYDPRSVTASAHMKASSKLDTCRGRRRCIGVVSAARRRERGVWMGIATPRRVGEPANTVTARARSTGRRPRSTRRV
jgi:hypothetical protein